MREIPSMILPIKKRISNDLFIGRTAALYIGETHIRVATNRGDLADWRSEYTFS